MNAVKSYKENLLMTTLFILLCFSIIIFTKSAQAATTNYTLEIGASVTFTNNSSSNFQVSVGGIKEYVLYYSDGKLHSNGGGSLGLTIPPGIRAVVTNKDTKSYVISGPSDVFFPVASTYPAYTYFSLQPGESATVTNNSPGVCPVYGSGKYDLASYNSDGTTNEVIKGYTSRNISPGKRAVITNAENVPIQIFGPYELFHPAAWAYPAITYFNLQPGENATVTNNSPGVCPVYGSGKYDLASYNSDGTINDMIKGYTSRNISPGKRAVITNAENVPIQIFGPYELFRPAAWAYPALKYITLQFGECATVNNNSPGLYTIYATGIFDYITYNTDGTVYLKSDARTGAGVSSGKRTVLTSVEKVPIKVWGPYELFCPLQPPFFPISGIDGIPYIQRINWDSRSDEHYWGDPVDISTGAHVLERTLLNLQGVQPISFNLQYNSLLLAEGPIGKGWGHNFESRLKILQNGIQVYWNANRVNFFADIGNNKFSSSDLATRFDTLVKNADGSYTLTRKDQSIYQFNASGQMLQQTNSHRQSLYMSYLNGRLVTVSEPISGRFLNFNYNASGLIDKVTDSSNRQVIFTYDTKNNLVKIIDAKGQNTTYTYNTNSQVLTAIDSEGVQTFSNTYDEKGRVATQDDAVTGNQLTTFIYDETSQPGTVITTIRNRKGQNRVFTHDSGYKLVSIKDELGNLIAQYTYDSSGNRISAVDANNNANTFTYDTRGNMLTNQDHTGHISSMAYDERNNLLLVENALGNKIINTFDNNNNITSITDPIGNKIIFTYDDNSLLLTKTMPRGGTTTYSYQNGQVCTITDATGNTNTYGYDNCGRLISLTNASGKTTTMTYDEVDNLTSITDQLGYKSTFAYNSHHNRIAEMDSKNNTTRYMYNGNGKLVSVIDAVYNETRFEYDGEDNLEHIIDARGNTTTYIYDAKGRLIGIKDPMGNTSITDYDTLDRITGKWDALGNKILSITYDDTNNIQTITDAVYRSTTNKYDIVNRLFYMTDPMFCNTEYRYDALGRLSSVIDPMTGESIQRFDADGNIEALVDPNQYQTSFEFYLNGSLKRKYSLSGYNINYQYNTLGLLEQMVNSRGQITSYQYYDNGHVKSFTDPTGSVTYTYDTNGNIKTVNDSTGTIGREYDELNRVRKYTDIQGNIIEYEYDSVGNLKTLTYPGGKQVKYEYYKDNRLYTVTDWAYRVTTYEYYPNGLLWKTIRPNGTIQTLEYDVAAQLKSLKDVDMNGNIICQYNYTYFANGNIESEQSLIPEHGFNLTEDVMTYTYDNRVATFNGQAVNYDADGNMTFGPLNNNFTPFIYDSRNRLLNAGNLSYGYDAENNRITVTEGVYATSYFINPNTDFSQVLIKTDPDGNQTFYVYGLGLIGQEQDSVYKTYHYDRRGSTIAITDENSSVTDRFQYSPYGELVYRNGSTSTPFMFSGRHGVITDNNGLLYMRARYYNPEIGRFINQDVLLGAITNGQSLNRYAYVNGNPIMYIDPSGFWYIGTGIEVSGNYYLFHGSASLSIAIDDDFNWSVFGTTSAGKAAGLGAGAGIAPFWSPNGKLENIEGPSVLGGGSAGAGIVGGYDVGSTLDGKVTTHYGFIGIGIKSLPGLPAEAHADVAYTWDLIKTYEKLFGTDGYK